MDAKLLKINRFLRFINSIGMGINVVVVLWGWESGDLTLLSCGIVCFFMSYFGYKLTFRAEENV